MLRERAAHGVTMAVTVVAILTLRLQFTGAVLLGSIMSNDESSFDAAASQSSLYHQGYPPVHVTRLSRYDHSGLQAFLEREQAWESKAPTKGSRRMEMSPEQTEHLRRHHESWLQQRSRKTTTWPSNTQQGAKSTLQSATRTHSNLDVGQAVLGLSNLNSQYVGPMGVGTVFADCKSGKKDCMGQEEANIWSVFDTGSTNIWISSDLCLDGPCVMEGRQRYNHTRSHTYLATPREVELTVQFGTGKLHGLQGIDDLHIGPFTVHNQTFAMIRTQTGSVFEHVPFEGIVGLAFPAMSANKVTPFFDNVIHQKVLRHNEFGVYFSPSDPTANALFWGGVDHRFYEGSIEYFPVVDPYYWAIGLHSFRIGSETLLGEGSKFDKDHGSFMPDSWDMLQQFDKLVNFFTGDSLMNNSSSVLQLGDSNASYSKKRNMTAKRSPVALLDTGTTYFTAESDLFDTVMDRLPSVKCHAMTDKTHPPITFGLKNAGGTVSYLEFTHDMYMVSSSADVKDSQCSPAFMRIDIPYQHGPGMVLGETFLRNYFTVFDRGPHGTDKEGRVGMARSVHTNTAIDRLRELTVAQPSFAESRQKVLAHGI